jgi:hypothetical protein
MNGFKLGLRDPRPGSIKLQLADYIIPRKLPTPPPDFGHYPLVKNWGVLGNDLYGDCAPAAAAHQSLLWCAESKTPAPFDTPSVLQNYSGIAGFVLNNPATGQPWPDGTNPTDTGTDLDTMLKFWRNTGMVDAAGKRHMIAAYVEMKPGNLDQLWAAAFLFQGATLGFDLPNSALEQTQAHQTWDATSDTSIAGGHCVPCFGRAAGLGQAPTWGQLQPFTDNFYTTYNNQGACILSEEMLTKMVDIDGVKDKELRADLAEVTKVS